jgi:hypothetical protein
MPRALYEGSDHPMGALSARINWCRVLPEFRTMGHVPRTPSRSANKPCDRQRGAVMPAVAASAFPGGLAHKRSSRIRWACSRPPVLHSQHIHVVHAADE